MTKLAILPLCVLSALTQANEADIEKITVTGSFRETTLEQLSASATIINQNRLASRQPEHLDSVLSIAPNVNFASGASRGRFIQIRGIGERSQFVEPYNPSVSLMIDDFDFAGLGASGLLFDTQQVEVFRGPQATVFGTGALAGAVKIQSTTPGKQAASYLELRGATKNSYRLEAAHGDQLSHSLAYRGAILHNQSDGFVENTFLQRKDTNNIDETAARLGLLWTLSDTSSIEFNYRWYDIDNGYDAFSLDNNRQSLADEPGFDRQQTHALSLNMETAFTPGTLNIIVTHASHNIGYGYDEDWTYTGFHPWGYTSSDVYIREFETQTAEWRFTSNDNAKLFNNTTDWVIGARFKGQEEDLVRYYTYSDFDFASNFAPTTVALYGETQTQLSDKLSLTVGMRVENYDFEYSDNQGMNQGSDQTMIGGKVALSYDLGGSYLYSSISRGFKGPGINPDQRVSQQKRFFEEEYNWNYELGLKGTFLSPDVMARIALFYMERKNTQVSDSDVQLREDGTADFIAIIDNADLGTNQGVEVELTWAATDNWEIQGSVGYLDATFEGFTRADGTEIEKQDQAQAPDFTANLISSWWINDTWRWNIDVDVKDEYRFSDGHEVTAPFTALVNTEIVYQREIYQISAWVKNVFDREYYVRGFGGFSNDPRDFYEFEEPYYQLGDGRQVGVTFRYQF